MEDISFEEMQSSNAQLRVSCICNVEMKLIGKTKIGTTACSNFETSTGIKDSVYLYSYECQFCTQSADYEKTICNH